MMTKKSEIAEWILDFFRRANVDSGQIIMMRNLQNKLHELNPKERDMFVPVANELIENGYFVYEEGAPQVLRLTQKGRNYIYNPSAVLDCCHDVQKLTMAQSQYMANWHDSFVNWVNSVSGIMDFLSMPPMATDEDRKALAQCKVILNGNDVGSVEKSLSNGVVTDDVLDKIEMLNKRLVDTVVEHIKTDAVAKECLKRLCYLIIKQDKSAEEVRLSVLRISKG